MTRRKPPECTPFELLPEVPTERLPPIPWTSIDQLPQKTERQAWGTCETGSQDHCILSQFIRAFSEILQRLTRMIATERSGTYWSEYLYADKAWARLFAPLKDAKFVEKVNNFDAHGKRFIPPQKSPYGPTRFISWCKPPSNETSAHRAERKASFVARLIAGKVLPRKFKRAPLRPEGDGPDAR
jgi:hypothetical protein